MLKPRSVLEALAALGIDGKEDGAGEMNLPCPLHNGRGNNFGINLETGVWICRSQCGGGNLRQLASKMGKSDLELKNWPSTWGTGLNLTATPATILDEYDEAAWMAVTREPPESELRRRGIHPEIAALLGLRFNPWNPKPDLKQGPKSDPAWMIPLRHPTEYRLIGWQVKGTVTGSAQTTGKKNATLFGIELVDPERELIVIESPLDVAVMMTAGLRNVVATFGTSIGVNQIEIIRELDPVGLMEAMDNDESGRKAAKKLLAARPLRPIPKTSFAYATADPEDSEYRKDPGDMTAQEILDGAHGAC